MKLICKDVKSHEQAAAFVAFCEEEFEQKIRSAAKRALLCGNKIITLSGPTCSGKTTTAAMLVDEIGRAGKIARVISIDDFYLDDLHLKSDGEVDFDSVNTIDIECLAEVTSCLLKGENVKIPKFDFMTGKRSGFETLVPSEDDVYIFEGIQAVYPEVVSLFGDKCTSVFICVNDDVMFNGVYFASHEIRLLRRIVRDSLFRNTSPTETLSYWDSVRKNEEENIFPNAKNPHVEFDSFLMYELFVIAPIVRQMLSQIDSESEYYPLANSLKIRLAKIDGDLFSTSYIPKTSVFREFIGQEN